jgi:hypothetical protein
MKRIEKVAIVLIVVGTLQGPAMWCLLHYTQVLMQPDGKNLSFLQEILGCGSAVAASLISLVCAGWLYLEAERQNHSKWVWCLLGLLFKLPAVAVFYSFAILETLKKDRNANHASDATSEHAPGAGSSAHQG